MAHDESDEREQDDSETPAKRKPGAGPGCAAMMFVLGVVAIVGGGYLMGRWDALGGAGKAGSVMLVVAGSLLALPLLGLLVLRLAMFLLVGWMKRKLGSIGANMLGQTRALYEKLHEFRPAAEADFEGLDRDYYENTTRDLLGRGFRQLGDLVDQTIEETSGVVAPIRVLVSADGTTTAALYHLVPPGMPPDADKLLMCDVTTEFDDGTFLMTSNSAGHDLMTPPPQIQRRQFPLDTPVADMLAAHASDLDQLTAKKASDGGASPVIIESIADALASERRQQAAKNAFRKGIGYLDPEEVRRIAANIDADPGVADLAAEAADEARRKRTDEDGPDGRRPG